MELTECVVAGCTRSAKARGWCMSHYNRWRRHGDPMAAEKGQDRPHFHVDPQTGCWNWARAISKSNGYGVDKGRPAHRVYWQLVHGVLPSTMHIDHLCRNRACVNPAHLEPVTPAENVRRRDLAMGRVS